MHEEGANARRTSTAGYQPHLDGLRAVAVTLVVAFHAGADRFVGGYIGVDVFFVLSGFLVTRTLLSGREREGSIRLGTFYSRRIRRLLPAASVNLVVTALVFRWLANPVEAENAVRSIRAAALYVSNWWFIREDADYFGTSIEASPVLHYWSLSVEEQFYVVWPLLLGGLLWVASRYLGGRRRLVAAAVAVGGVLSLGAALSIERTDPVRAYYGTDTRVYQLFAGALLALLPGIFGRLDRQRLTAVGAPIASAVSLAGIVLLGTSTLDLTPVRRGAVAAVLTVVLIVALQTVTADPVRRFLSIPPLVYLGRISYGIYLWHWIVIQVALRELDLSPWPTFLGAMAVASGLAALSFELLEQPIRRGRRLARLNGPVIACGLAISVLVGVVAVPRILEDTGTEGLAGIESIEGTPVTVDLDAQVAEAEAAAVGCSIDTAAPCDIHDGDGATMVIVGDSHAQMLAPAFLDAAEQMDLEVVGSFMRYCPWLRGISYFWVAPERCLAMQDRAFDEVIAEADPDVVVLIHHGIDDAALPLDLVVPGEGKLPPGAERDARVEAKVREVVEGLRADGRRVLLVEPIPLPVPNESVLDCLSGAEVVEECRRVADPGPTSEERVFRALDEEHADVWSLDLDLRVCPYLPICDPIVNGEVVSFDGDHVSDSYAATFGPAVTRFIEDNDVVPDATS